MGTNGLLVFGMLTLIIWGGVVGMILYHIMQTEKPHEADKRAQDAEYSRMYEMCIQNIEDEWRERQQERS
jgi:hypothetical protein